MNIKFKVPATQRHHENVLRVLAGSLLRKFGFFMDCLGIQFRKCLRVHASMYD